MITKAELNLLNPCCMNCEFIGRVAIATDCQRTGNKVCDARTHVCPMWAINMDIDSTDVSGNEVIG
jgi:hypothetical protein